MEGAEESNELRRPPIIYQFFIRFHQVKLDTYDPGWKDSRLYSPKPQPETITYDTINRDTENQRLLRLEFIVPAEALQRGANEIAVSVRRTGAFPPRKFVTVEKVELHLK